MKKAIVKPAVKITKAALLNGINGIKDKSKAAAPAKKIGKRAATAADPASIARMQADQKPLDVLMKYFRKGQACKVHIIRAIVGNFPLLHREAIVLLTGVGFNKPTISAVFQGVRSGDYAVPSLPKDLTK